jgi:uncharacterized membrane protein YgaE (UPF0421/DUF939 family)
MPADVMQALAQPGRDEPLVKRLVQSDVTRFATDIDRRTLEVLTAKIMAGTAAVKAATEARRAVHELARLDDELLREDELRKLRHETQSVEEREKQEWLRMGTIQRRQLQAKLKAGIRRFDLQSHRMEQPPPKALESWEQYLRAWMGSVTGGENFESRTDDWLADYRERRRKQVSDDDPRREEKLARIEASVEELRNRRDQMMRDLRSR